MVVVRVQSPKASACGLDTQPVDAALGGRPLHLPRAEVVVCVLSLQASL